MPDNVVTATPTENLKQNPRPQPAAITTSRSCRFLNLSLFQSKASPQQQQYNRSASVDDSRKTCLAFHSFREALFCEQPISSCHDQIMSEAPQQQQQQGSQERKVSRWRRIMGRFGGKKNREREDDSQCKEQNTKKKKPRHVVESSPAWDTTCKWVECGDLSRRDEPKEEFRSPYELVKPVLEPMRFATSDLAHCPDERKDVISDGAQVLVTTHLRQEQGVVVTAEVRVLARDHPPPTRGSGAITPLISMLDSSSSSYAHSALLTLYTLASGNNVNKAAIVDAGIIPKLLNLLCKPQRSTHDAVVAIFLSLSALDRNKPLIGSAGAVPELIHILNQSTEPIRWESLRALYNLSLSQPNIKFFVESGAVMTIVDILDDANVHVHAEKALAVLSNMVGLGVGRKCVTETVVETLIRVLGWAGFQSVKCQERAAYVLMVIAHHSYAHRQAMVQKRAIPALLEVSLLGSALAQKRAVRILECLREDRELGLQPRPMSAPMGPPSSRKYAQDPNHSSRIPGCHGSKVVSHMVRQSLEQNLQRIVRRANLPLFEILKGADGQSTTTHAFSLAGGSSSKSLQHHIR